MTGARAPRRMLALALALEGPKPGAAVRAGPQPPADAPTVATKGRRSFSVTLDQLRMLWARAELAWRDETDPGRGASDPAGCLAQEPWPFPPVREQNRRARRCPKVAHDGSQLRALAIRLDSHAAEQIMLSTIIAGMCEQDLKRAHLVATDCFRVTAVDRHTAIVFSPGAEPWHLYLQLVTVEQASKDLKGDLAIRPIFHQRQARMEMHIFIAFLAYCLRVTLAQRLRVLVRD
jgi:hypothetical protein